MQDQKKLPLLPPQKEHVLKLPDLKIPDTTLDTAKRKYRCNPPDGYPIPCTVGARLVDSPDSVCFPEEVK